MSTRTTLFTLEKKDRPTLFIWLLITLFCATQSFISYRYNNYLIFENVFRNLTLEQSLYEKYPALHGDSNHYGPIFGVFIMPFALLANSWALFIWDIFNCLILFFAIKSISVKNHQLFYWIAIPCLVSSMLSEQFNPTAGALMIFSYTMLHKNKGFWSALFIVLGTFIKLYGIVGLAFFFFAKDKIRFIAYLIFWAIVLFLLPMWFSSPQFIISSYQEWFTSLIHKNESNIVQVSLDISIMGFFRKILGNNLLPNSIFLIIGCLSFALPYLNFKAYQWSRFHLYILASVLLFPVLFSSGSEDCTYIISIAGVGIWYVLSKQNLGEKILLGLTILFSCNFPLLLFPKLAHQYPILLSMFSVPFFIVWVAVIIEAFQLKENKPLALA